MGAMPSAMAEKGKKKGLFGAVAGRRDSFRGSPPTSHGGRGRRVRRGADLSGGSLPEIFQFFFQKKTPLGESAAGLTAMDLGGVSDPFVQACGCGPM